jgi:Coenzyme PQQ synthesis protein D (PqqD)
LQFHEVLIAMQLGKYVKFREEKFGGVLFETQSEKVYTLNPTAAAIIRELGSGCDATELTQRLADRFQAPIGTIERDVAALIADLRQKGLVEDARS